MRDLHDAHIRSVAAGLARAPPTLAEMLGDADGLAVELSQTAHLHPVERRPASEERCETILP
jgi:hypothetical protein